MDRLRFASCIACCIAALLAASACSGPEPMGERELARVFSDRDAGTVRVQKSEAPEPLVTTLHSASGHPILVVAPDPNVDYKIGRVLADPNIDYSIIVLGDERVEAQSPPDETRDLRHREKEGGEARRSTPRFRYFPWIPW